MSLFSFGFENLKSVVFTIGIIDISFLHLLLLSFMFVVGNFVTIAATPTHRSAIDFITNTKQMDVTTYL